MVSYLIPSRIPIGVKTASELARGGAAGSEPLLWKRFARTLSTPERRSAARTHEHSTRCGRSQIVIAQIAPPYRWPTAVAQLSRPRDDCTFVECLGRLADHCP
jgi:hypothetical protein